MKDHMSYLSLEIREIFLKGSQELALVIMLEFAKHFHCQKNNKIFYSVLPDILSHKSSCKLSFKNSLLNVFLL